MLGTLVTLGRAGQLPMAYARVFVWMHGCHVCAIGYLCVSACGGQKTAWAVNPRVLSTLFLTQATSLL